jgi:cyclopropane fatty-acyl-phospholipid synthase-like methyltransferase
MDFVKNCRGDILEVGNVLSHYFAVTHDIVDKYEKAAGVINQDVVDINLPKKYDLIVSISTLEHVGWDETSREPGKINRAIKKLKKLLNPNGKIVVTMPIGYSLDLDKSLKTGKVKFDKMYCLKRISKDNKWVETDWESIRNSKYDDPFPFANGLVIGLIKLA